MRSLTVFLAIALAAVGSSQSVLEKWRRTTAYSPLWTTSRIGGVVSLQSGKFAVTGTGTNGGFLATHFRNGVVDQVLPVATTITGWQPLGTFALADGSVIVVGQGAGKSTVTKYSSNLTLVYDTAFSYNNANIDYDTTCAITSSGNIFIAGEPGGLSLEGYLYKVDGATGAVTWTNHLNVTNPTVTSIVPDGETATVLLNFEVAAGNFVYKVMNISSSASGSTVLTGPVGSSGITRMVRGTDGTLWLSGTISGVYQLIKVTGGVGVSLTSPAFVGPLALHTIGSSLYVAGDSSTGINLFRFDPATFPFETWYRSYGYGSSGRSYSTSLSSDGLGELYLLGYHSNATPPTSADSAYLVAKFNPANGLSRWSKTTSQENFASGYRPSGVAFHDPSGDVFLAGLKSTNQFTGYVQAPITVSDLYRLRRNTAYDSSTTLTFNDRYFLGATCTLDTGPNHGTVVIHGNRTFTYTPDAGYVGTDTFRYRLTKTGVNSVTGAVTLVVLP